ncbi:MAG: hypothetical protein ACEPOV_04340 [Hyphomicrobiales bacterium]
MAINNNLISGFIAGVGLTLAGIYVYQKNKDKVDDFLRSQGINIPENESIDFKNSSLEDLVSKKEHIEDLIAEYEAKMNKDE